MSLTEQAMKIASKSEFLKSIYHKSYLCQNILLAKQQKYYQNLDPKEYPVALKTWYEKVTGKPLNLENPKTFNEKIQWMKLHDSTPLKTRLADKYLVRDWIAEKIGEEYLIPLLGVWDTFDDIDFDTLPNQFVLKANHGSGWNVIVRDKAAFDKREAKKKFDQWLKTNYAYKPELELHYRDIVPKIIAEEYIENNGGNLYDYKVHCFNGDPKFIQYIGDRAEHNTREIFYNINWEAMPFTYTYPRYNISIPKPNNFSKMIEAARTLSNGFRYVRVDFYQLNDGSLKFGELTFTPAAGKDSWNPDKFDKILGDLIILNIKD